MFTKIVQRVRRSFCAHAVNIPDIAWVSQNREHGVQADCIKCGKHLRGYSGLYLGAKLVNNPVSTVAPEGAER